MWLTLVRAHSSLIMPFCAILRMPIVQNCYVEENFKFTLKKSPKKVHFYLPVYSSNEHQISKPLHVHVYIWNMNLIMHFEIKL